MTADRHPRLARITAAVAGLLLAVLIAFIGWKVYRHLYFDRTPAYRAGTPLFEAARTRPLTPDEFDRAVALADCGETVVELRMWAAIDVAVGRTPDFKPKALALYTRRAADPSDPRLQALAAKRVARLAAP